MSTRENVHLAILRQRNLIRRQNSPVKRSRENVHQPRMGPLSIRHQTAQHVIARTQNETRWVARFWREHFVAHGGKIFAISLTSSFPVRFFSEPWKIRRPLQR